MAAGGTGGAGSGRYELDGDDRAGATYRWLLVWFGFFASFSNGCEVL